MAYHPPERILNRYADVMVNFALNSGKGIKKGETVYLLISEEARPFMVELRKAIWKAGGNIVLRYIPSDEDRYANAPEFYNIANSQQLSYTPERYFDGIVDEIDHVLSILSRNPKGMEGVDPKKLSQNSEALSILRKKYSAKELRGELSWTLALYGTPELAKEAGLSQKKYWEQIIKACHLNTINPVQKWKETMRTIDHTKNKLNKLPIDRLHVEGDDVDLWISLGKDRQWLGGSGHNIPSFEVFTSPDWRGTEGWIKFNQPLYYNGNKIRNIRLEFTKGLVTKATAETNQKLLREMISKKDANKVGEFSLTDKRLSKITEFMADTLYDENVGGPEGNTHIALGSAYKDAYSGKVQNPNWTQLGFNDSIVHTDIISTTKRTVTAIMRDGSEKVIYTNGKFTL